MSEFKTLFDEVFGPSDDYKMLRKTFIDSKHGRACQCLSCHFSKVFQPPDRDFRVDLELAGVKRDRIKVTRKGDVLNVEYTTRFGEVKNHSYTIGSRYYDMDKLSCKYEDGLLTVVVPLKDLKVEEPPPTPEIKIEIK